MELLRRRVGEGELLPGHKSFARPREFEPPNAAQDRAAVHLDDAQVPHLLGRGHSRIDAGSGGHAGDARAQAGHQQHKAHAAGDEQFPMMNGRRCHGQFLLLFDVRAALLAVLCAQPDLVLAGRAGAAHLGAAQKVDQEADQGRRQHDDERPQDFVLAPPPAVRADPGGKQRRAGHIPQKAEYRTHNGADKACLGQSSLSVFLLTLYAQNNADNAKHRRQPPQRAKTE